MRRGLGDLRRGGRKVSVTVAGPVTFVVKVLVKQVWVSGLWSEMPALLIRMSIFGWVLEMVVKAVVMEVGDVTSSSSGVKEVEGQLCDVVRVWMAVWALERERAVRITWYLSVVVLLLLF